MNRLLFALSCLGMPVLGTPWNAGSMTGRDAHPTKMTGRDAHPTKMTGRDAHPTKMTGPFCGFP
jgi:hypothetical protein